MFCVGHVQGVLRGDVGELLVHSPNMSTGYLRDAVQTQSSFVRSGDSGDTDDFGRERVWYRTGDLVRVTENARVPGASRLHWYFRLHLFTCGSLL